MNAPFRIRPYTFDQVFETGSVPLGDTAPGDLHLRVAALEAELALATLGRDEAVAAARTIGFEEGMVQANGERQDAILAAVDALHATVESVEARMADFADEAARDAAGVALIAAELIAGQTIAIAPAGAIDEAIGRVLMQVARGQEIQVAVHPDLAGEVERLVAMRQAGDRRRLAIAVVPDATRGPVDAHIHWDHGGVVLDAAARIAAVRAALAPVLEG